MAEPITKRQDKVNVTLARLNARLEDLRAGKKDKKFQKDYDWDKDLYGAVVQKVGYWGSIDYEHDTSKLFQPRWSYERDVAIIRVLESIRQNEKKLAEAIRLDQNETNKINAKEVNAATFKEILANLPKPVEEFMKAAKIKIFAMCLKHRKQLLETVEKWKEERKNMKPMEQYYHRKEHEGKLDSYKIRLITMSEEEIKKDVERDVEYDVVELMKRVTAKVGKVVNAENLHYKHGKLNGYIEGEKVKVYVETILAGGYNIQCLHIRTLIK